LLTYALKKFLNLIEKYGFIHWTFRSWQLTDLTGNRSKTSKRIPHCNRYFLLPQNLFPQIWHLIDLEYITNSSYFGHAPHILTAFISVGLVLSVASSLTWYWYTYIDVHLIMSHLQWYWCLQLHKRHDMQPVAIQ
jgi:hypothetical protein